MLLKILALAVAAIPVLLFLRTVLLRRPTRIGQHLSQFKREVDVVVWLFIALIGVIGAFTAARMVWTWWAEL